MQRHQVRRGRISQIHEEQVNNNEASTTDDEEGDDYDAGRLINGDISESEDNLLSSEYVEDEDYDEDFEEYQEDNERNLEEADSLEYADTVADKLFSKDEDEAFDEDDASRLEPNIKAPEKDDEECDENSRDMQKDIAIIEGIIEESRARCKESLGESLFKYSHYFNFAS